MHRKKGFVFVYLVLLIAFAAVVYGRLIWLACSGRLFLIPIGDQLFFPDFVSFYGTSSLVFSNGAAGSIYDPQLQAEAIRAALPAHPPSVINLVAYPPFFFTAIAPLAWFTLTQAWILWCLAGLVCLLIAFRLLLQGVPFDKITKTAIILGGFAAYPTWLCFRIGQTSLFVFAIFAGSWWFLRRQNALRSGGAAALSLFKIQYAPIFVLAGTLVGRIRYVAGFTIIALILFLISLIAPGWSSWTHYPSALRYSETHGSSGVSESEMQNFRGELLLWTHNPDVAGKISVAVFIITALAIALLWMRIFPKLNQRDPRAFELCASLTVLAILTTSFHAHVQDYVVALLACTWLFTWITSDRTEPAAPWLRLSLTCAVAAFPVLSWVLWQFAERLKHDYRIQPFFVWAIATEILALLCLRKSFASNRSHDSAAPNL